MRRFGLLITLLLLTISGSGNVHAQTSMDEAILSFDSNVTISADNEAKITETITYQFGPNQKHGIYRYVPTRTIAGDTGKFYYYTLEWGQVLQDGQPATVKEDNDADFGFIRIGDADKTISGSHVYEINYVLSPIAEKETGGDFINLNITGNDWGVPITSATAKITNANGAEVLNARCYTGVSGSTAQDCTATKDGNAATFTAENLGSYEGLTANVFAKSSNYATYLAPQDPPPPDLRPYIGLGIGLAAFAFGVALRIKSRIDHRRRKKDETIVPQYEPPKDLSVGEIGTLHDNSSDMKEITATLIDLAVRGCTKITQLNQKTWFKAAQYQFDLIKTPKNLAAHEQKLLELLFKSPETSVNLNDVSKTEAGTTVSEVKKQFVSQLEEKGYRVQSNKLASQKVLNKIFGWSVLAIVIWAGIFLVIAATSSATVGPLIATSIFGITLAAFGYAISTTIHITDEGYDKWAEIEGLIMYLTVAEKDRLAFHDAPEKSPKHFSALLPAAIALGVDKQWANQFKDLDIAEKVDWYSGPNTGFNSVLLASSLSHDLNSTVASSFTPPSQSSGGSGGGGFSGGGGGGGGGGSW